MIYMIDHELRERIAIQAMNGLLSNSHFSKHMLKAVEHGKALKKNDRFFDLISFYSCQLADSLIDRLDKTRRIEKLKKRR